MSTLEVSVFEGKLVSSLQTVKSILGQERSANFQVADHVPHSYQDKYLLAEQFTNCSGSAFWNGLTCLGLTADMMRVLQTWVSSSSTVTLRFEKKESNEFVKERTREEESKSRVETEQSFGGLTGNTTTKVITKITEFFYTCNVTYSLTAVRGVGASPDDVMLIRSRSADQSLVYRSRDEHQPDYAHCHDLDLTFPLNLLTKEPSSLHFGIDRSHGQCFTPVRNPDSAAAMTFFAQALTWCAAVTQHFHGMPNVSSVTKAVFVPIVPLLRCFDDHVAQATIEDEQDEQAVAVVAPPTAIMNQAEVGELVAEQIRSLQSELSSLSAVYRPAHETQDNLFSTAEAGIQVVLQHLHAVSMAYNQAMMGIEEMIRSQLIAAIGREIAPVDLSQYMSYHYRRLYRPSFQPVPCSFAIRRSDIHAPEGSFRLETQTDSAKIFTGATVGRFQPIETFHRSVSNSTMMMSMKINASTAIRFGGERHVHGWLTHSFSDSDNTARLRLVATARQFSSFILVLGQLSSASSFEPKHAVIIQNKEELLIPLLTETIPNAQQFRDAIESLSPEQQRFAKAYRSMQLESTLFALVVLQVKPQLEKVLNLPPDSLTKEIRLTQDLTKLFIDHQIPADLLSFDESASVAAATASSSDRIAVVKRHVLNLKDMLDDMKEEEIQSQNQHRAHVGFGAVPVAASAAPLGRISRTRGPGEYSIEYEDQADNVHIRNRGNSPTAAESKEASSRGFGGFGFGGGGGRGGGQGEGRGGCGGRGAFVQFGSAPSLLPSRCNNNMQEVGYLGEVGAAASLLPSPQRLLLSPLQLRLSRQLIP